MTEAEVGVNNLKGRKAVGAKPLGSHAAYISSELRRKWEQLSQAKWFKNVTLNICSLYLHLFYAVGKVHRFT